MELTQKLGTIQIPVEIDHDSDQSKIVLNCPERRPALRDLKMVNWIDFFMFALGS